MAKCPESLAPEERMEGLARAGTAAQRHRGLLSLPPLAIPLDAQILARREDPVRF